MRFCYNPSESLIPTLLQEVRDLLEETPWYSKVSASYPAIPMPTSYRKPSPTLADPTSDDDSDDVDDDEEFHDDEEENAYDTRREALAWMMEPASDMVDEGEVTGDEGELTGDEDEDDEVEAIGDGGENPDGTGGDPAALDELRARLYAVQDGLTANYDKMLGDAAVTEALKALETAAQSGDRSAFEEAYRELSAAVGQ